MSAITIILALVIGLLAGLLGALFFRVIQGKSARGLARELLAAAEVQRQREINLVIDNIKSSFGNLSAEALAKSSEQFLQMAKQKLEGEREVNVKELDSKKGLIDEQLKKMGGELENVTKLVRDFEKDRQEKFGQLTSQLKATGDQTSQLLQTTNALREALAHSRVRGQWGERMAEDVLRIAGFIENVNYWKNKSLEGAGTRPDFTFLLPKDLRLNMDVKFPFENYVRFVESKSEQERKKFCGDFLRDVRLKIREVSGREYVDPDRDTVNCVLLFIPNEQLYHFIQEQDPKIFEEALGKRVVFCSPITLFAVLAIVRQAVENFRLEKTSNEIVQLLASFRKNWGAFVEKMEGLGTRLRQAQDEYDQLSTTRRNQLERPLNKIEVLRQERNLPLAEEDDSDRLLQVVPGAKENPVA